MIVHYKGGFFLIRVTHQFKDLTEGIFLERINRFLALVKINEEIIYVHVPSSGRMKELLLNGSKVYLRKGNKESRKTSFDILLVEYNNTLVCIDSHLPNRLIYKCLKERNLNLGFNYNDVKTEVKYNNSRFDFCLIGEGSMLIEIKSVTLVEEGIGLFPDAPSSRGTRHLTDLIKAKKEGIDSMVLFVIQRNDAEFFMPNYKCDMSFFRELLRAFDKNVIIMALLTEVSLEGIRVTDRIPIIFPEVID